MTYTEFNELRKNFYKLNHISIKKYTGTIYQILGIIDARYGWYIKLKNGYRGYSQYYLPANVNPKKGDIIQTYDGCQYTFMNTLKRSAWSCISIDYPNGKRIWIGYNIIYKINGESIYAQSKILEKLLSAIKK